MKAAATAAAAATTTTAAAAAAAAATTTTTTAAAAAAAITAAATAAAAAAATFQVATVSYRESNGALCQQSTVRVQQLDDGSTRYGRLFIPAFGSPSLQAGSSRWIRCHFIRSQSATTARAEFCRQGQ